MSGVEERRPSLPLAIGANRVRLNADRMRCFQAVDDRLGESINRLA